MGCCKCEKYRWDEPQPVIFRAPRGSKREYCVFHAPSSCKEISAQKFNKLIEDIVIECAVKYRETMTGCNLSGVVFPNNISLLAKYEMPIYFAGAKFRMDAIFPNVQFLAGASFERAVFYESAYFEGARFDDGVEFGGAKFKKGAYFQRISVAQYAGFWDACFYGGVNFSEASFHGNVFFDDAVFKQSGQFSSATFARSLKFDRAFITERLNFSSARLFYKATFENMHCKINAFDMSHVSTRTIVNISFSKDNFSKFSFQNTDYEARIKPGSNNSVFHENMAELFRLAKRDSASEHDQPGVSIWHYKEKSAMLELIKEQFPWLWHLHWLNLYRLSSGYGERENRAFICLIVLILIPLGLNTLPRPELNFPFSELVNSTLPYLPFTKELNAQSGWMRLGQGVSQLLIAIQTTIFAFALRNRFRR